MLHILTNDACRADLVMLSSWKWRVYDRVTAERSCFYLRRIKPKSSNACWVNKSKNPEKCGKTAWFEPKFRFTVFFKSDGPVHISHLGRGKTTDHLSCINDSSSPFVESIKPIQKNLVKKPINFTMATKNPYHSSGHNSIIEQDMGILKHSAYAPDLVL